MNVMEKLRILSGAARYDASCASSGARRPAPLQGIGNSSPGGICHSWTSDGRCVSLLKILFTNRCIYDCAYCVNRRGNDIERASFTVREVVGLTVELYRRNCIEGLFLSSGVERSPEYTLERMVEVARSLRRDHSFGGYIHLKIIPGSDLALCAEAGFLADRLSVNIELPSEKSLRLLAPGKERGAILKPMGYIGSAYSEYIEERRRRKKPPAFSPAGQSTQLIIGASPENDHSIMTLSQALYRSYGLKRVYYSAYIPVNEDSRLPVPFTGPPLLREHRLYQTDWLMRFYDFEAGELLSPGSPHLDTEIDPKAAWALRHLHRFPVDICRVDYRMLLRVPGIGVRSAKRICAARKHSRIRPEDLRRIGVALKRAKYFIEVDGIYQGGGRIPGPEMLRRILSDSSRSGSGMTQPDLFAAEAAS